MFPVIPGVRSVSRAPGILPGKGEKPAGSAATVRASMIFRFKDIF